MSIKASDVAADEARIYLFVWVRTIVAEHQVGSSAVEQQVCRFEGERKAMDALTEVIGVPQVIVGGVYEKVLGMKKKRKKKKHNTVSRDHQDLTEI